MKGASAMLPITTMNNLNPTKMTAIGGSQFFVLTFIKSQNSDMIFTLLIFAYCQIA